MLSFCSPSGSLRHAKVSSMSSRANLNRYSVCSQMNCCSSKQVNLDQPSVDSRRGAP